jgi:basic membrane protein A
MTHETKTQAAAPTRRDLFKGGAVLAFATAFGIPAWAQGEKKVIGFLASGPWNDFGFTQSHLDAMEELAADPDITILKEEGVPETADVQRSIRSMIELDGAQIIVGTSYGYFDPHMIEMAKAYPDVQFLHCGGY